MTATNNIVPDGTEQSWDSALRLLKAVKHVHAQNGDQKTWRLASKGALSIGDRGYVL